MWNIQCKQAKSCNQNFPQHKIPIWLSHIHHWMQWPFPLVWSSRINASADPEALCNIQVHTLTCEKMSHFGRKDLCFLLKNLKYTLHARGSVWNAAVYILCSDFCRTASSTLCIRTPIPSWQLRVEKHHCLLFAQTTHLKSASKYWAVITNEKRKDYIYFID